MHPDIQSTGSGPSALINAQAEAFFLSCGDIPPEIFTLGPNATPTILKVVKQLSGFKHRLSVLKGKQIVLDREEKEFEREQMKLGKERKAKAHRLTPEERAAKIREIFNWH